MRYIAMIMLLMMIGSAASAVSAVRCENDAFLLASDGTEIIAPGVYTDIVRLSEDRFAVCSDTRYALANENGEQLTAEIYTDLEVNGDLIKAGADGYYAVLDMEGNALSSMIYSKIVFGDGRYAWALRGDGDQLWVLSEKGAAYAPCGEIDGIADRSGDGLLAVKMEASRLWGYCDASGRPVIEDLYDQADPFMNGRARVVSDGYYGVIDPNGAVVVPFEYESLRITQDRIIAAQGQTVTVMDSQGETISRYEDAVNGFGVFGERYAVYGAEGVCLYAHDGTALGRYSADTQLREGVVGGIIIDDGPWGAGHARLFGAEDAKWLELTPLGCSNGSSVYRGGMAEAISVYDAALGEEIYRIDHDSMRYTTVSETGIAMSDGSWRMIRYLEDDRFWVENGTDRMMIDAEGNIYYRYEKKVS